MQRYCLSPVLFACCIYGTFFFMMQQPLVGQGVVVLEASRSHSDTPNSVGLLWTSDQPIAETSTWRHTTRTTDRHPCFRRDSNPQFQQASGRRPTPQTARPLSSALRSLTMDFAYILFGVSTETCCWNSRVGHILPAAQMTIYKFSQEPFISPNIEP